MPIRSKRNEEIVEMDHLLYVHQAVLSGTSGEEIKAALEIGEKELQNLKKTILTTLTKAYEEQVDAARAVIHQRLERLYQASEKMALGGIQTRDDGSTFETPPDRLWVGTSLKILKLQMDLFQADRHLNRDAGESQINLTNVQHLTLVSGSPLAEEAQEQMWYQWSDTDPNTLPLLAKDEEAPPSLPQDIHEFNQRLDRIEEIYVEEEEEEDDA